MMRSLRPRNAFDLNDSSMVIKYMLVCLAIFISSFAFSQADIDRATQCACINNNAPTGFAQFEEEIVVNSIAGETWYIESVSGFYQLGSPLPPANQIEFVTGPMGDTLVANGAQYSLSGLLVENLGYSITVTNGVESLELSNILCAFPSSTISGDDAICGAELEMYTADNFDASYTYNWDAISGGTIMGPDNEETVSVQWDDNTSGNGQLRLQVTGPTGCFSFSYVNVEFEEDINLACNNLVHIAINATCGVDLGVDDILENMQYNNDSYEIEVIDPETGETVNLEDSASDYLNDTLEVSVIHLCSENSCWGNLIVEDKQIPQLLCENDTIRCDANDSPTVTGFPLPNDALIIPLGGNNYRIENFDPCGDAELSFTDETIPMSCIDDFGSVVERTFLLTDFSGSTNTCTQSIFKERTTLDDVVFPGDWDGITNPVLSCNGGYPTLPNGYPDPSYTGFPEEGVCDHINISYVDLLHEVCGATYKIVRKITAHDECENESITVNQIIKIEDSEAPDFNCPQNMDFYISESSDCETNISTPLPSNVFDCSEVTFEAEIVKINDAGNIAGPISDMILSGGVFTANDRELGRHRITYTGTDECGLDASCTFIIEVFDGTAPTAVCDLNTTIAIDTEGTAVVPYTTFDNGSFDNCDVESVLISRGSNQCGASSGFSESITLCCADVNNEVLVTLRVTDYSGNVNTCVVAVMVQDKKAPVLTCPPNQTISCNDDIQDLSAYGVATVTDNCSATIEEESSININDCSVGTITRTFRATDVGGNVTSCTQIITVQDPDPLTYNSITWPGDYSTNDCVSPNLDPDDLPFNNAYPQIGTNQCSNIVVDYDDKVFIGINTIVCKTIIRTWTVKDLCGNNPDGFSFPQTLEIIDNQLPQFDECSNKLLEGTYDSDCNYNVELTKTATDQCTPAEELEYSYTVDFNDNGSVDLEGNVSSINATFPVGQHKIVWTVMDECSNENTCTEFITIEDNKQPTPYCLGGISTVLMPSTGTIGIWANDFDVNSEDDCTAQENLEFSFSSNPNNSGRTFSCEDLEGADEKIIELQIYVHDEAGNYDFCTSYIRLQDNNNTCDTTSTKVALGGLIYTEDQKQMEFVDMELTNMIEGNVTYQTTNESGIYAFQDLDAMLEYSITPSYEDDDVYNGITTLDILLIQKHILGLNPINSPYKIIAADVDANESINGIDILQIRKLLLGYYDEFPSSPNWKFVDGQQEFENPYAPWPYNDKMNILADQAYGDINFVMVKTGDINLSRETEFTDNTPQTRNNPVSLEYEWTRRDGQHILVISSELEHDLNGIQLELELNDLVNYQGLKSELDIKEEDVFVDNNTFRLSWSGASAQRVQGTLLELTFGAKTPVKIPHVGRFESEIYTNSNGSIDVQALELKQKDKELSTNETKVYQNRPNPFIDRTEIVIELAESEEIKLEVHDMNGRLQMDRNISLEMGRHSIWISNEEVNSSGNGGVFIYTISGSFGQISKRMIIIQ